MLCAYKTWLYTTQSYTRELRRISSAILASHALKVGILSVWWNPKWQHKLAELEGRLVNLDTYYQAQICDIMGLRVDPWYGAFLQSSMLSLEWLSELPKALHGVSPSSFF